MGRMLYRAQSLSGEIVEGAFAAESERDVRLRLSKRGLTPISISQASEARTGHGGAAGRGLFPAIKSRDLRWMTSQMALMLATGSPLAENLSALAAQTASEKLAAVLERIHRSVSGGSPLHRALGSFPAVFTPFYISAVRAGESSGELDSVFERLEEQMQKRERLMGSLRSALTYPIILAALAVFAVAFMMTFVLPRFVGVFAGSSVELPAATKALMSISDFCRSYWYVVIGVPAGAVAGFAAVLKNPAGKARIDRFVLMLPLAAPLIHSIQTSAFLRTLGTLLGAGIPIDEALEVAEQSCSNSRYRASIAQVRQGIVRGESFSDNLSKSELFSLSIKQMIATGEKTGQLAMVAHKMADHLDATIDEQTKRVAAAFEPAIIILMGVVIGFIAIALLMPLFKLSSAIKAGA